MPKVEQTWIVYSRPIVTLDSARAAWTGRVYYQDPTAPGTQYRPLGDGLWEEVSRHTSFEEARLAYLDRVGEAGTENVVLVSLVPTELCVKPNQ